VIVKKLNNIQLKRRFRDGELWWLKKNQQQHKKILIEALECLFNKLKYDINEPQPMGITEDSFEEISAADSSAVLMKNRFMKSLDSDVILYRVMT
jgi:hypothetical protein